MALKTGRSLGAYTVIPLIGHFFRQRCSVTTPADQECTERTRECIETTIFIETAAFVTCLSGMAPPVSMGCGTAGLCTFQEPKNLLMQFQYFCCRIIPQEQCLMSLRSTHSHAAVYALDMGMPSASHILLKISPPCCCWPVSPAHPCAVRPRSVGTILPCPACADGTVTGLLGNFCPAVRR